MRVDRHSGHSASIVALDVERRTREDPQSEQFKLDESGALLPAAPPSGRPVGDTTPDASDPEDASCTIVNEPLQSVQVPGEDPGISTHEFDRGATMGTGTRHIVPR